MINHLARRADEALDGVVTDVTELVRQETHSRDLRGLAAGLDLLMDLVADRVGPATHTERHPGGENGDIAVLTYVGETAQRVAVLGHYDTVWPAGTLGGWPVEAQHDSDGRRRITGPGIFDMKTGLVQGIWALKLLRDSDAALPTVTFVFNGDEEIGSPSSRRVIERIASEADATLVLEPSVDGALKTGRKGTGIVAATATGIESHAGLDPDAGASAIHALAEFITAAARIADPASGTTINAGLVSGGSGANVVAGKATASLDIRVSTEAEQDRVDAALDQINVSDARVRIDVRREWNRPPMTLSAATKPLLQKAQAVAAELGRELNAVTVGGASDANFVAGLGRPVLCGLGAVGGGAHARGEFIYPDSIPHQTALVAGLLHRLAQ